MKTPNQKLHDLRRLLLPALWDVFGGTKIDADISIDGGNLLVIAKSDARELAFCISEKAIADGSYKWGFSESLRQLYELVAAA